MKLKRNCKGQFNRRKTIKKKKNDKKKHHKKQTNKPGQTS
jgi:hypothetical protein